MHLETRVWETYYWYLIMSVAYQSPEFPNEEERNKYMNFFNCSIPVLPCYQYRDLMLLATGENPIEQEYTDRNSLINYLISIYNFIIRNTKRYNFLDREATDKIYNHPACFVNFRNYMVYLDHMILFVFQGEFVVQQYTKFLRMLARVHPIHELRGELEYLVDEIVASKPECMDQFKRCYLDFYKHHFKRIHDTFMNANLCKKSFFIKIKSTGLKCFIYP